MLELALFVVHYLTPDDVMFTAHRKVKYSIDEMLC